MASSFPTSPFGNFQPQIPSSNVRQSLGMYSAIAAPFERVVRPFQLIDSAPPPLSPPRQPLPGEENEAFIAWGKPSNFLQQVTDPVETEWAAPGFKVEFPKNPKKKKEDGEEDEEQDETLDKWSEIDRTVTKIRVENPSDPDQYVMVERVETIDFSHENSGRRIRLVFKNETSKTTPKVITAPSGSA